MTEHGVVIDYGALLNGSTDPLSGLTVTDGTQSTTTDAQGNWSLTLPAGSPLAPSIAGTSRSDPYSTLFLPTAVPAGSDVDRGSIVAADQSTFSLEQTLLQASASQSIVHVGAILASTCPSAAGATVAITSPSGAQVEYFDAQGYPNPNQTSFAALTLPHPVAVFYDVTPGAEVVFQVTHPTCKAAAFPFTSDGASFTGQVTTMAASGNYVSVVLILLQ